MLALEELHLAQPLKRLGSCLVRATQIAALRRQYLESALHLYDHGAPPETRTFQLPRSSVSVMMSPVVTFPQEHRRRTHDEEQHHEEIVLDDHIGLLYLTTVIRLTLRAPLMM